MADFERVRRLRAAEKRDAAERAHESYDLFFAGPYVNFEESAEHPDNVKSSAHQLRYHVVKQFESEGTRVYYGEDIKLREIGDAHFGEFNNAAIFERHYILENIHATIIAPSSPGSFCELGDWVTSPEICEKLLIIIDRQHQPHKNYINDGVVLLAKDNHASVEYIDYTDLPRITDQCRAFVNKVAARNRSRRVYGR